MRKPRCRRWRGDVLHEMNDVLKLGFVMMTACLLPVAGADASGLQARVDACAEIGSDAERLECFDALVQVGAEVADGDVANTATEVPAAAAPEPAPAEPGSNDTGPPAIIETEARTFEVRLVRCSTSASGARQLYFFDNGEVWQQSNVGRTKIKDCDTDVRIRQDLFGYKMEVPSEDRRVRIRPVR